jgi:hypothetical protein
LRLECLDRHFLRQGQAGRLLGLRRRKRGDTLKQGARGFSVHVAREIGPRLVHAPDGLVQGQPKAGHAQIELALLAAGGGRSAALEQRDELGGVAEALVQSFERHVDAGIVGPELEQRLEVRHGSGGVVRQVLRRDRRLRHELPADPRILSGRDSAVVQVEQVCPSTLRGQSQLEPVECPARTRGHIENLPQEREDRIRAAEPLLVEVERAPTHALCDVGVAGVCQHAPVGLSDRLGVIELPRTFLCCLPEFVHLRVLLGGSERDAWNQTWTA